MRTIEFNHNSYTFKRINKKTARRAYKNGLTVIITPCNLKPFSPWHPEFHLNRESRKEFIADEVGIENDFNNWVNSFEYYNCINTETGKYAAYYIPVKWINPTTGAECGRDYYYAVEQYDYRFLTR